MNKRKISVQEMTEAMRDIAPEKFDQAAASVKRRVAIVEAAGGFIAVDTSKYERSFGKKPRGRGYWKFKLCTERVTEKDHHIAPNVEQSYDAALDYAREVATRRRCHTIVVLP